MCLTIVSLAKCPLIEARSFSTQSRLRSRGIFHLVIAVGVENSSNSYFRLCAVGEYSILPRGAQFPDPMQAYVYKPFAALGSD